VVRRSYGPNKHVQIIKRAQNPVLIEREGANQGDDVFEVELELRLTVRCTVFEVELEL
jgi:hypothetical protein